MPNWFPVFKAGEYKQGSWPEQKLQELYERYDSNYLAAPFTVDHKQDGPAYGYAGALKFEDGTLYADKNDMSEDLKAAVKNGNLKRVSVEIYKQMDGKPYLKAISLLGVKAPQVKGLEPVQFEDAESEHIDFEVQQDGDDLALVTENTNPATESDGTSDSSDSVNFEELKKENNQLKSRINQLERAKAEMYQDNAVSDQEREEAQNKLREITINQRMLELKEWLNEQLAFGRIMPRHKEKIEQILNALDSIEMFEDAHGTKKGSDLVALFQDVIHDMPKLVQFEEVAKKSGDEESGVDTKNPQEVAKEANKLQVEHFEQTGEKLSAVDAVQMVYKNNQKQ